MPVFGGIVSETQGIQDWTGITVLDDPPPTHAVQADGRTAELRLMVPWARHQTIMSELIGYSYRDAGCGSPPAPVLKRKLPEIFYYAPIQKVADSYPNNKAPALQTGTTSAYGYALYAKRVKVEKHTAPVPDPAQPPGYLNSPPWFDPTVVNAKILPWKPEFAFAQTILHVEFETLPYLVCYYGEVPTRTAPANESGELLRYTKVVFHPQNKFLQGNWADWVFDPASGTPLESTMQQVGKNFGIPEASAIVEATWFDVDANAFNQLTLNTLGNTTNNAVVNMGQQKTGGFYTFTGDADGTTSQLLLLGYNPEPIQGAYGDQCFTVKMTFLFEPQGVNVALNPGRGYVPIHRRGAQGTLWPPTPLIRPLKAQDYTKLSKP